MPKKRTIKLLVIFFLILIPLIIVREWFLPGLPQTHDAEAHISRAAVFAKSITEGNILPRWGGYLNWRYGTPSIMFLYPGLPYFSAIIHLVTGLTFIDIYKLLMIISYLLSGWIFGIWMKKLSFSSLSSLTGALFYILAPYRLVNIFVRGALAEHIGFLFFPLLLLTATNVIARRTVRSGLWLSLTVAGLILTHNLSALLYLPFIFIYPLFYSWLTGKKIINFKLLELFYGAIFLGITTSSFFWIPVLFETKYTLASWMFDVQKGYLTNFLAFRQLIWSPWGYGWSEPGIERDGMSFQVGIANWIVLLFTVLIIISRKLTSRIFKIAVVGLGITMVGMILSLPTSLLIWNYVSLIQKFQFPWRFLSLVVAGSAISAGVIVEALKNKRLAVIWLLLPLLTTFSYWKIAGPSQLTEKFLIVDYVGTSDTGETSPRWAIRFQEKFPKSPVEIVSADGSVIIKDLNKLMEKHKFTVVSEGNARIVDNTVYFPGWTVYVDGEKTPIEYQDQNWRGLITFPVSAGEHQVKIIFERTLVRKLADTISLLSLGVSFLLLLLSIKNNQWLYQ